MGTYNVERHEARKIFTKSINIIGYSREVMYFVGFE